MSGSVKVTNEEGTPIRGLQLSLNKNQTDPQTIGTTNELGLGQWDNMDDFSEYTLTISDTDADLYSGEFTSQTIDVEPNTGTGDFSAIVQLEKSTE